MKSESKKQTPKPRSDGGSQALSIGPQGVSENESPTINAVKRKPRSRE